MILDDKDASDGQLISARGREFVHYNEFMPPKITTESISTQTVLRREEIDNLLDVKFNIDEQLTKPENFSKE